MRLPLVALPLMLFTVALVAHAQSLPDGAFTGSESNKLYTAKAQLQVNDAPVEGLPVYPMKGTIVLQKRGIKKGGVAARFRTELVKDQGTGKLIYKDRGKTFTLDIVVTYDTVNDRVFLNFESGTFGKFEVVLERRVSSAELVGNWAFPDGAIMTIKKVSGETYQGTWQGLGTHSNLFGNATGRLRQASWLGRFEVQELDVQGRGAFRFQYLNEVPPLLTGTLGTTKYQLRKR